MNRRERLVLAALLGVLLLALLVAEPVAGALGTVAGAVGGVALAQRLRRVRLRVERRIGPDLLVDTRLRPPVVLRRAVLQLGALGALLLLVGATPFVGNDAFAVLATAATALPLAVTVQRLR